MRIALKLGSYLLLGAVVGCGLPGDRATPHKTTDRGKTSVVQTLRPDTVLAILDGDTVAIVGYADTRRLRWTSFRDGKAVRLWQSRPLGSALPSARLVSISIDSLRGLFWTISYEDQVGGQLLVAADTGAQEVFSVDSAESCAEPELRDVTGDGLLDIIEHRPAVLTADECHADALAEICSAAYPLSWGVVHVQKSDGRFVNDPRQAKEFYLSQSGQFLCVL